MTNSIQQNTSTVFCKFNAELAEIKRVSRENVKLFYSLLESLNELSDELAKLDCLVDKKLMEK